MKLNGVASRTRLHSVAVSDIDGVLEMNLFRNEDFLSTGSSLSLKPGMDVHHTKQVRTVSLDSFLPNANPIAVKIDVEGHELNVLRGMTNMLERSKPRLLIEVWQDTRMDVLILLESLGYNLTRVEPRDREVNNFFAISANQKD